MFDIPQKRNIPLVYNFTKDPKESMDIAPDSTWILPVVMSRVVEFQITLKAVPPILFGTPDPYVPPKKEK